MTNNKLGGSLAATLGDRPVALMRGHGNVVVGPNVQRAVLRAIYTEVNARLLAIAISLGGPIKYISAEEVYEGDLGIARAWEVLKHSTMGK